MLDRYGDKEVLCPGCGKANEARGDVCDICGHTVDLKLKYDMEECQERGMTYAVPLKVPTRLVVWNKDPETGVKTIRDIKEQEVPWASRCGNNRPKTVPASDPVGLRTPHSALRTT